MDDLKNLRVAILATDGVEEPELTEPRKALDQAGARTELLSPKQGQIQAFRHHDKGITIPVDGSIDQANPDDYDAVLLPGGALNADAMRMVPKVKQFLQAMQKAGKPVAVICHAPWELVSAGLVEGRTLTSWPSVQDDIRNAGGNWVDREVVVDGNWVSSRKPDDIPAFNREMTKLFASRKHAAVR
jgi:protease I